VKDEEVEEKERQIDELHRQLGKVNAGLEFLKKYRQIYAS
jgi:hypothetical protein